MAIDPCQPILDRIEAQVLKIETDISGLDYMVGTELMTCRMGLMFHAIPPSATPSEPLVVGSVVRAQQCLVSMRLEIDEFKKCLSLKKGK